MYFLGYEIIQYNHTALYVFYIFTNTSIFHIIWVNPNTHTILNCTAYVSLSTLFSYPSGNYTHYSCGEINVCAYKKGNIIVSKNGVILEKICGNETIKLKYANYPGIASENLPNLNCLAGYEDLFCVNTYLVLGIILSASIFFVLRRFL
ncbi:MAG: hypothetical protein RXR43_12205 [Sulfolobus sp.]|jgi:hypothetical protein